MIYFKSENEINIIAEGSEILSKLHGVLSKEVKSGVSTLHLDKIAAYEAELLAYTNQLAKDIKGIGYIGTAKNKRAFYAHQAISRCSARRYHIRYGSGDECVLFKNSGSACRSGVAYR